MKVSIIGAGLAGSECAYQLLKQGIEVDLYEMKPTKFSPAHKDKNFAELVCSNSLKSNLISTAGGMLKQELRILDSLLIKCADECAVPAGSALAVDRHKFSELVTTKLKSYKNLHIIEGEITSLPEGYVVIATGPLTSDNLSKSLAKLFGDNYLYFFDAIAPIVSRESIDFNVAFEGDRYGKGNNDYINCPFTKEDYLNFYQQLINGEIVQLHDFENSKVFEGCMPIEVLAKRGVDAMRYGPLKPVGIKNPATDKGAYAVVQLRKENVMGDYYNIVGFQTNLTYGEQSRIFKLIPGLQNAEFVRFGSCHKNTYINAPKLLNRFYQLKSNPNIFVAGQLSGVEGYIESISSGLAVGLNLCNLISNKPLYDFPNTTMIGALSNYLENASSENFQPMSSNMGIVAHNLKDKDKQVKNTKIANKSFEILNNMVNLH
ncbi:MAG: methylenetetrahydrofolate--tRNA-(uracil(54)-C(5))-methyltransferase (FADH(2)-oxidizing) TrmFO [Clostridia bacterium]|nr:methylenetetrahydrofolate--tRNA-(uracil(54)-C(5))-methyltransferase (FADH(2)-oxidizing) TrmFO [Clostridia bacterium]